MNYFYMEYQFIGSYFTTTDEFRELLVGKKPEVGICDLAKYIKYYGMRVEDVMPLPPIPILPEKPCDPNQCFPDGKLPDILGFGSYVFVSERIKRCFDAHDVHAYYCDAYLDIGDKQIPYHIFEPTIYIDAVDRERSIYIEDKENLPYHANIDRVKKLYLDERKIEGSPTIFELGGISLGLTMAREDLINTLNAIGAIGFRITAVEDVVVL